MPHAVRISARALREIDEALFLLLSPVHGAFRAAVVGPPLTAGCRRMRISRAPFNGAEELPPKEQTLTLASLRGQDLHCERRSRRIHSLSAIA